VYGEPLNCVHACTLKLLIELCTTWSTPSAVLVIYVCYTFYPSHSPNNLIMYHEE